MSAEIWIVLILIASALAAAAGYFYARRGAPSQAELDTLQEQLAAATQQAEKVQADVTGHFEQSAVLFGRLANDYRAFLEHFSASARELGISESMARELLQRADQPLLGHDADVVDTQPADTHEAAAEVPADDPEPPLIDDVVKVEEPADITADTDTTEPTVASVLVDVDMEPSAPQADEAEQTEEKPRSAGQAG